MTIHKKHDIIQMKKVEKFDCLKQEEECYCNSTLCNLNKGKIKVNAYYGFPKHVAKWLKTQILNGREQDFCPALFI